MRSIGYAATALAIAACVALAGCSGGGTPQESEGEPASQASSQAAVALSSSSVSDTKWEYSPLDEVHLENSAQTIFDNAAKDTGAEDYTPVAVLATKGGSGANYAFLCETPKSEWHIVAIHQKSKKSDTIVSDVRLDAADVRTGDLNAEGGDENFIGGWEPVEPDAPSVITEASLFAFDAATTSAAHVQNIDLTPIATLGAQKAEPGINYRYLCAGVPDENAQADGSSSSSAVEGPSLYIFEVHATSDDNASATSLKFFDFLSYIHEEDD